MSEPSATPEPAAASEAQVTPPTETPESTKTGPGRLLVAVYGLFALSAFARAAVQIATEFSRAPVAYLLSALAAVIYILATATLVVGSPTARRIAFVSCSVELVGVLAVGTWSVFDRATFPDATVWSTYGVGYGFVPLVLPVFGLLWLRRLNRRAAPGRPGGTGPAIAASASASASDADEPTGRNRPLR